MTYSRFDWQDVAGAAAWIVAAFLVLALVNLSRGAVPPPLPPNPQIVRQPDPGPGDLAGSRSARAARPRRQ